MNMTARIAALALAMCSVLGHGQATNQGPTNFPQINSAYYVGSLTGTSPQFYPTVQSAVTAACASANAGASVNIPPAYTGSDVITSLTGCAKAYIVDQRAIPLACYVYSGGAYSSASCSSGGGGGGSYANHQVCAGPLTGGPITPCVIRQLTNADIAANATMSFASCSPGGSYDLGYHSANPATFTLSYSGGTPSAASISDGTNTSTLSTPYTSGSLAFAYPLSGNTQNFSANATFTSGATASATCSMALSFRSFVGYANTNSFTASPTATGSTGSPTLTMSNGAVLSGTTLGAGLAASATGHSYGPFTPTGSQYICLVLPNTVSNPGGGSFTVSGLAFPMSLVATVTFTNLFSASVTGYGYCSTASFLSGSYTIVTGS